MLVTSWLPCGWSPTSKSPVSHFQARRSVLTTPRQRDTLIAAHGEGWWVEDCIDTREESTWPRRAAAVAMSATAATTAATSIAEAVDAPWHEVRLGPASAESAAASLGEQLERGDVVLCLPEAATPAECVQLTAEASAAAEALRQARFETGLDPEGRARLPTLAAAARATAAGTPCAAPLSPEADAICCRVLRRMLRRIDAELPSLGTQLFGGAALGELLEADLLDFSSREPAVNVYGEGGARPIRPGGIGPDGRGRGRSGAVLTPCARHARARRLPRPQGPPAPHAARGALRAARLCRWRWRSMLTGPPAHSPSRWQCPSSPPHLASSGRACWRACWLEAARHPRRREGLPRGAQRVCPAAESLCASGLRGRRFHRSRPPQAPASGRKTRSAIASRLRRPCCDQPQAPRCSSAAT